MAKRNGIKQGKPALSFLWSIIKTIITKLNLSYELLLLELLSIPARITLLTLLVFIFRIFISK